jgi:hypothetical protein
MPVFTIETTFHLPVYRHRSITADTLEEACRLAIADEDWWEQKHDYDNSGETYVSGAWQGPDAAYQGDPLPIPSLFDDPARRKADRFETLLALLKKSAPAGDTALQAAITEAEAIPPVTGDLR